MSSVPNLWYVERSFIRLCR